MRGMYQSLLSLMLVAPTCLGADLSVGFGQWQTEVKGETGQQGSSTTLDDLGFDQNRNNMFVLTLEHPVPVIPQVRLMHTDINTGADAIITQPFSLGTVVFEANVRTLSTLVLSHSDITFYYEILDNWLEIDLGVTTRVFDGYVEAQTELSAPVASTLEGALPMLYLDTAINLPFGGLSLGGTANVIRYRGDGFHDYSASVGYMFEREGTDLGIQLGFRKLILDVAEFDDLYVDASLSGAYLALFARF